MERVVLHIEAGPDAGRSIDCVDDPIVVGRAQGRGRIEDPSLEVHHLLVHSTQRTVVQLTGRVPACVDGRHIGQGATLDAGSVIEVGATRLLVASGRDSEFPGRPSVTSGVIVLGVGPIIAPPERVDPSDRCSFVALAAARRSGRVAPITIDPATVRRVLVTGPVADGVARSILERAADHELVVAVDPDPDAAWPGGDLPSDGAILSVGATWRATLTLPVADGSSWVRRFHAAGTASRPDRSFVAQEVARSGSEPGGDVVRIPQAARRERQASAADALVELVSHPGQERDLLVEPRPPGARQPVPVLRGRRAPVGERRQRLVDLGQ